MRRLLIGLALALIALPAWAQTRNANMKRCLSEDDPDITIAGCNALIQSGHETAADLAIAYNKRGIAYVLKAVPQGPYDQAIADSTKALALRRDYADAYDTRAIAYHWKGEDAKGLPDSEKAVALAPKNAQFLATRARIYEKLGQRDKAVADYRAILKLAPGSPSAEDAPARLKELGASP